MQVGANLATHRSQKVKDHVQVGADLAIHTQVRMLKITRRLVRTWQHTESRKVKDHVQVGANLATLRSKG